MAIQRGTLIRSLAILGFGVALGAAGGALVYKKLHPASRQDAAASRPEASRALAPPEGPPEVKSPAAAEVAVVPAPVEVKPPVIFVPPKSLSRKRRRPSLPRFPQDRSSSGSRSAPLPARPLPVRPPA
jgi:hypothetical protein